MPIECLVEKHENAKARLKALEHADAGSWQKIRDEVDQLVEDIDKDLRQAMAYFG